MNAHPDDINDAINGALARAVVYRTLSMSFQPPSVAGLHQLGASHGFEPVTAALRFLDRGVPGIGLEAVAARLTAIPRLEVEPLAARFVRLFGHTARGLICACETEYGPDNGFHQPQQLADIAGYYLAFGLRPTADSGLRVDHIACECEFMDFLNRKEARLVAQESPSDHVQESLDATRQAARHFLRDHLARFGCACATRLAHEDRNGYYGIVGHLLLAFLKAECARLRIDTGPVELRVRPAMVDETPMACGTPDQLIQIQRHPRT
jgi:TorA maturation chaperone TorD